MDKIWLNHYPHGVPAEIDTSTYPSLKALIEESLQNYAELPAFTNFGGTLTYSQVDELSTAVGSYLTQSLAMKKGDRVALILPNVLQYPVVLFGVLRTGLIAVNVNPLYTAREMQAQLRDSGAEVVVVLENFAHTLEKAIAGTEIKHVIVTKIGDLLPRMRGAALNFAAKYLKRMVSTWSIPSAISFQKMISTTRTMALPKVDLDQDDIAFLQYTGGTTGRAKGAELTHGNLVANILQADAWLGKALTEREEVIITALPLYHIFSLMANCLLMLRYGSSNILITNPRDIKGFIKELGRHQFTVITGVNTLFNALLNAPAFARLDFSRLKLALGGGMAVQRAVAERWQQITGVPLLEAYGLTETSPAVCINPLDLKQYNGSIGLPIPSTVISIRDDSGSEQGIGEPGELCVKGPQVMKGYWNCPEETANAMTLDGFLRTGDIAYVNEDGYVFIVDRKKDMILVSGFNVYPNEIEDVIAELDGVSEVAAVGVPDPRSTEAIKVFVVRKDPSLQRRDIIRQCRENLTGYKIPKFVEFRDTLPKSNVGKILRKQLRDEVE